MTEAAGALVEFGFHTVGLGRLELRAHVDNIASGRIAEKVGMRREGRAPRRGRAPGGEPTTPTSTGWSRATRDRTRAGWRLAS